MFLARQFSRLDRIEVIFPINPNLLATRLDITGIMGSCQTFPNFVYTFEPIILFSYLLLNCFETTYTLTSDSAQRIIVWRTENIQNLIQLIDN